MIVKKISAELFNSIEIDVQVDDLVISKVDDEECMIKVSIKNNLSDDITQHLIDSNRYDINTTIRDEVLYINYIKEEMSLLTDPDYFEIIGVIILVPRNIPYKQIEHEE